MLPRRFLPQHPRQATRLCFSLRITADMRHRRSAAWHRWPICRACESPGQKCRPVAGSRRLRPNACARRAGSPIGSAQSPQWPLPAWPAAQHEPDRTKTKDGNAVTSSKDAPISHASAMTTGSSEATCASHQEACPGMRLVEASRLANREMPKDRPPGKRDIFGASSVTTPTAMLLSRWKAHRHRPTRPVSSPHSES